MSEPTENPPQKAMGDHLLHWALIGMGIFLIYRFFLPQPSAPLEGLQHAVVAPPGPVRLIELAATHCPSCLAMTPIVEQVRQAYKGRAEVTVLYIDRSADSAEAARLSQLAGLRYTPTFLVIDRTGRAGAKFIGPSSYAALSSALDAALADTARTPSK